VTQPVRHLRGRDGHHETDAKRSVVNEGRFEDTGERGYDVGMAVEARRRLFTADEYFAMARAGIFDEGPRVELLDGEVVEMSPQGDAHVHVSTRANHALVLAYDGTGYEVRPTSTFRAGPMSVPEPDFGVVPADTGRVLDTGESVLLVEVSDTSLSTDRRRKRGIYARTGAPCYWIVEIPKRQVRVLTDPSGRRLPLRGDRDGGRGAALARHRQGDPRSGASPHSVAPAATRSPAPGTAAFPGGSGACVTPVTCTDPGST